MMMKIRVFLGMAAAIATVFARGMVMELQAGTAPETARAVIQEEEAGGQEDLTEWI